MKPSPVTVCARGIALILALLLPAAGQAAVELTPMIGYGAGGLDVGTGIVCIQAPCPSVASSEDSVLYGALLDIPLNRQWQVELLVNRQSTDMVYRDHLDGDTIPTTDSSELDLTHLHAGLLRSWQVSSFEPFIVLGAGQTRIASDPLPGGELDADRFSANLGGGVKMKLSDRLGVRFEVRGLWVDMPSSFDDGFISNLSGDLLRIDTATGLTIRF